MDLCRSPYIVVIVGHLSPFLAPTPVHLTNVFVPTREFAAALKKKMLMPEGWGGGGMGTAGIDWCIIPA